MSGFVSLTVRLDWVYAHYTIVWWFSSSSSIRMIVSFILFFLIQNQLNVGDLPPIRNNFHNVDENILHSAVRGLPSTTEYLSTFFFSPCIFSHLLQVVNTVLLTWGVHNNSNTILSSARFAVLTHNNIWLISILSCLSKIAQYFSRGQLDSYLNNSNALHYV